MIDKDYIKRTYEAAEFWGVDEYYATKFIQDHSEIYEIKEDPITIKIIVVNEQRQNT